MGYARQRREWLTLANFIYIRCALRPYVGVAVRTVLAMSSQLRVASGLVLFGLTGSLVACTQAGSMDEPEGISGSSAVESEPPSGSSSALEAAATPDVPAPPEVGSDEAISVCGDALYYFYLDSTFNDRFNLDDVRVEGNRYVFENQGANYDYPPGHPYASDPELAAYVDTLVVDNDTDIWREQEGETFNVGFVDGESQLAVTMAQLQQQFDVADQRVREFQGLS